MPILDLAPPLPQCVRLSRILPTIAVVLLAITFTVI